MSSDDDRRMFLHSILGEGKVAELMSWKKKTESAAMLGGVSAIWLLFEASDYHFVTLVSHLLILLMLLLFFWNKLALFTNWSPPNVQDFVISESSLSSFFLTFNSLLHKFFQISSGHDFKLFAMVMGSLGLVSVIGELASSLNLMYIVFVSLQIAVVLYEKYEEEFEQLRSQFKSNMEAHLHTLDSNFLSKIPRRGQIKQT